MIVSGAKTNTTTMIITGLKYENISRMSLRLFLLVAMEVASVSDVVMQISVRGFRCQVSGFRVNCVEQSAEHIELIHRTQTAHQIFSAMLHALFILTPETNLYITDEKREIGDNPLSPQSRTK